MKLDPGIHIVMHSVLSLKPGVTLYISAPTHLDLFYFYSFAPLLYFPISITFLVSNSNAVASLHPFAVLLVNGIHCCKKDFHELPLPLPHSFFCTRGLGRLEIDFQRQTSKMD